MDNFQLFEYRFAAELKQYNNLQNLLAVEREALKAASRLGYSAEATKPIKDRIAVLHRDLDDLHKLMTLRRD